MHTVSSPRPTSPHPHIPTFHSTYQPVSFNTLQTHFLSYPFIFHACMAIFHTHFSLYPFSLFSYPLSPSIIFSYAILPYPPKLISYPCAWGVYIHVPHSLHHQVIPPHANSLPSSFMCVQPVCMLVLNLDIFDARWLHTKGCIMVETPRLLRYKLRLR